MAERPAQIGAHDIRRRFLDFFMARAHEEVRSSPLVPANDPTLLFTNAGMVQFKDVFTGRESRPYARATTCQRCLRAGGKHNDLENVGFTPRHHTFFEMLGNFSFGDYFKKDAIAWGWEFLTEDLRIPADRLAVTVFNGEGEDAPADDEAAELWIEFLPAERIYRCDAKEVFWMMGDVGPCGPSSEIHVCLDGVAPPDALRDGPHGPAHEEARYLELWNLVFMQYEKRSDGSMIPLPKPSVDTGAGLERIASVIAGVSSNYETDLLRPLVDEARRLAGTSRGEGPDNPFQVIADHARATTFLIADGVFPDRTGRSYVLRRIMRRAIRYGTEVGLDEPFFHLMCKRVVDEFGDVYPEVREAAATIEEIVRVEEEGFRRTLGRGLRRLDAALAELGDDATEFPAVVAADLYDTYGFPLDLTALIMRERELSLDEAAAEAEVRRRQASGAGDTELGQEHAVADVYFALHGDVGDSEFLGYETTTAGATVVALLRDGAVVDSAKKGDTLEVVLDRTPFYSEAGGQVGDTGTLTAIAARIAVEDVVAPVDGLVVHRGRVLDGELNPGAKVEAVVDPECRDAIRRNHSATHLLHGALRTVLGEHVVQKGSLVAPDRLRFDFSHNRPLTDEQRARIELQVNAEILANDDSRTEIMSIEQAKQAGAIGLFGEKYGDNVRVVHIGPHSVELCGGTHVRRAGDIGSFAIVSEGGIAQGVRRIEAVTGMGAVAHLQDLATVTLGLVGRLRASSVGELPERVEKLQDELRARDREVADLQRKLATGGTSEADTVVDVDGVKLLAKRVATADTKTLRDAADTYRTRLGSGVVVLGAESEGKATLLVAVTKDLGGKVHAGKLVGRLAQHVDGRGGGRPDLAQAGGPKAAGLDEALDAARRELQQQLEAAP